MDGICNEHAKLCFHKSSLKNVVQDYVISFNEEEKEIAPLIDKTLYLVKQLFERFPNKTVYARIIAKVNYFHINAHKEIIESRSYYFPSYQAEVVNDVEDFLIRHLTKIASRMNTFNANGSNLLIDKIEYLYIPLTML